MINFGILEYLEKWITVGSVTIMKMLNGWVEDNKHCPRFNEKLDSSITRNGQPTHKATSLVLFLPNGVQGTITMQIDAGTTEFLPIINDGVPQGMWINDTDDRSPNTRTNMHRREGPITTVPHVLPLPVPIH